MTKSAPDYYSSVSIAGKFGTEMKPVLVDEDGQMYIVMTGQEINVANLPGDYFKADQNIGNIAGTVANLTVDQSDSDRVIQGAVEGNFPVVALDANGIILSRMKGAASGDLILKILDDCGDTTTITDWAEGRDGLNPADNQVYVKQGSHSMALGIDADKSGEDSGFWQHTGAEGDLSNYQHDWLYLWVYFPTLDYLVASGNALVVYFGSSVTEYIAYIFTKADLSVGWNLLKCDLDDPDATSNSIDWTAIAFRQLYIYEVAANTTDFTFYVDCLMFVRPTPGAGTLKDIAVDQNGIMLSKMTGQYADILKPIAIDQDGLMLAKMTGLFNSTLKTIAVDTDGIMKANLAVQDLPAMTVRPFYTETKWDNGGAYLTPGETDTLFTISDPGIIHGGIFYTGCLDYHGASIWYIDIDTVTICQFSMNNLKTYGIFEPRGIPVYILRDDDGNNRFFIGIQPGLTFESSCVFRAHNSAGELADDFSVYVWYSVTG